MVTACGALASSSARLDACNSGPQCVWDAFTNSELRGRPYFSCTAASSQSRNARGTLIRSMVTMTRCVPAASSNARALANRSVATPSEGFLRAA